MKFTLEPLNDHGFLAFQINTSLMIFEVLMAVSMMMVLSWVLVPCATISEIHAVSLCRDEMTKLGGGRLI
jgi:hypothetical protein